MFRARIVLGFFVFLLFLLGVGSGPVAAQSSTDPAVVGQWSDPLPWPIIPVHAHMLPDGRILAWQHEHQHDPSVEPGPDDNPYVWTPPAIGQTGSGTFLSVPVPPNPDGSYRYALYCAGHTFLPDGRLWVAGGHYEPQPDNHVGNWQTNLFDYRTSTWTPGPDMNNGRWYPTCTTLANSEALVISGDIGDSGWDSNGNPILADVNNTLAQVLTTSGTLRNLTGAARRFSLYPWMFQAPNGKVFCAGMNPDTGYLDTAGAGTWTSLVSTKYGQGRNYGSAVMYDAGKILILGGGDGANTTVTNTAEVIDLNAAAPAWRLVAPMAHPRMHANATLLPDGTVLVTGGTSLPGNDAAGAVHLAELWDPKTETWTPLASEGTNRLRHSTAVLLPDGRVFSGGGGQPTALNDVDHYDGAFYSPPYLFKGPRPTITAAPQTLQHGATFSITTPDAASITKVTLIRLPSVTHSFNENQRINFLSFSKVTGGLTVSAPASTNLCPPGHYMLFILNDKGVPSVATIVQALPPPLPSAPTSLTAQAVSSSQITLTWTDKSTNESGFKIERSSGGGAFTQIATVGAGVTSYSNTGLAASTTYTFRVRAYNAGGNSAYSNTASATTLNDPPVANNQSVTTSEDTAKAITLTASDADGDPLTYSVVTKPGHGTLSGTAPKLTYTPAANYNGPDSFTFRASDGKANSNTATVSITVLPVNDPPVARDDTASVQKNRSVTIAVLSNDTDGDGDTLTVTGVSAPANGAARVNADGTIIYTPKKGFSGTDRFTYTISDGQGGTATATVTVTVQ